MPISIEKNQAKFFNNIASKQQFKSAIDIYSSYIDEQQHLGMLWQKDCRKILDYGCGNGLTIDTFFLVNPTKSPSFTGIDIAKAAVENCKIKYPKYQFFHVTNNDLSSLEQKKFDGAFLYHVLHHSTDHDRIFSAIYERLEKGGKFFITDLTSRNPFVSIGLWIFRYAPKKIIERFDDDLISDGSMPEKYKVDIEHTKKLLEKAGFEIVDVGFGHLFAFLFVWAKTALGFSDNKLHRTFFSTIVKIERRLLKSKFFSRFCEVVYIKCEK